MSSIQKKAPPFRYSDFEDALQKGKRLILLHGRETALRLYLLQKAGEHLPKELSRHRVDISLSPNALSTLLSENDLFSAGKLVVGSVDNPNARPDAAFHNTLAEASARFLEEESPSRLIVSLPAAPTPKAKAVYTALSEKVALFDVNSLPPFSVLVGSLCAAEGVRFEGDAARLFSLLLDGNLPLFLSLLPVLSDAVFCAKETPKAVNVAMVREVVGEDSSMASIFDMMDLMVEGNAAGALLKLSRLKAAAEPLIKILWILHGELEKILVLCFARDKKHQKLYNRLKLWYKRKETYPKMASSLRGSRLSLYLEKLLQLDAMAKLSREEEAWQGLFFWCCALQDDNSERAFGKEKNTIWRALYTGKTSGGKGFFCHLFCTGL